MTPGARIAAAIDILTDIDARHRPVAEALKDWGLSHRFAGSGDRAAIGNIVYDALRKRRSFGWMMAAETPRALALGVVGIGWGEGNERLSALLEAPHAPEPLTPEEARAIDTARLNGAPDAVRADVPDWLAPSLARALGDGWVAELEAMAERPPLDLRVNRLKAERAKVLKALATLGAEEARFAPDGIRIPPTAGPKRHPNVQAEPAFRKGWFEVQDEGSQLATAMVGAAAGEQVLDLCAGGGGKTLALSAAMANKGQLHASDADKHRLAPIFDRLKRAGTRNVQVHPAGSDLGELRGKMDRVLVDAPCTGSGTWRRHPETKWKLTENAVADRCAEQAALLKEAAAFVKPGGILAYVTCSLLPEENEDQVAAFAAEAPFAPFGGEGTIDAAGLSPEAAAALKSAALLSAHGVLLTPLRTGTDAFFIALLKREA